MFTLIRLLFLPVRVGVGSTKLGVKAGYRAGRLLGLRRRVVFGAGVAVGLLAALVFATRFGARWGGALCALSGIALLVGLVRHEPRVVVG